MGMVILSPGPDVHLLELGGEAKYGHLLRSGQNQVNVSAVFNYLQREGYGLSTTYLAGGIVASHILGNPLPELISLVHVTPDQKRARNLSKKVASFRDKGRILHPGEITSNPRFAVEQEDFRPAYVEASTRSESVPFHSGEVLAGRFLLNPIQGLWQRGSEIPALIDLSVLSERKFHDYLD